MSMNERQLNKKREELIKHLSTNPRTTISFTKADGSTRVMNCTLMGGYVPVTEAKLTVRKENTDTIVAFDLDKCAWRSFRVDSIQSIIK